MLKRALRIFVAGGGIIPLSARKYATNVTHFREHNLYSTKKRGQYDNFSRKYTALKEKYPGHDVIAVMWFIDDSLRKN